MKSFHRVRSAAVLLAVAGAVLVSGALPASADSDVTFEPMTVEVIQDPTDPTMPRPTLEPPIVRLFPDLAGTYHFKSTSGDITYYHFTVKNIGGQTATGVKVTKLFALSDTPVFDQPLTTEDLGSVSPGQTKQVVAVCAPPPGKKCLNVLLQVHSGNGDSNFNNNYVVGE